MDILKIIIFIFVQIDEIITVSLFATLSVLSIAAAALLYTRPIGMKKQDNAREQNEGAILLCFGALSFMLGIPIVLLFDSVFEVLKEHLWVAVLDVCITSIPFIFGFLFLYSGLGNLLRYLIDQEERTIPKWLLSPVDKFISRMIDSILKPKKDNKNINSIAPFSFEEKKTKED